MYVRVAYFLVVNFLKKILPTAVFKAPDSERRKSSIHSTADDLLDGIDGPAYEMEAPAQDAIEGYLSLIYTRSFSESTVTLQYHHPFTYPITPSGSPHILVHPHTYPLSHRNARRVT